MILLDTSTLIAVRSVVLPDDRLALSAIAYGELWFGVENARDAEQRRARLAWIAELEAMFGAEWLPYDRTAAAMNGRLAARAAAQRPGHARSKDIMLAAHAAALGAKLLTLNPKDFELVADDVEVVVPARR